MSKTTTRGYGHTNWATTPNRHEARDITKIDPVVYVMKRRDGIIKVGWTSNITRRAKELGGEILAFKFGTRADEAALHARLADHLAHGREYYYPTPGVLAVVNELRADLGLPHLDAA